MGSSHTTTPSFPLDSAARRHRARQAKLTASFVKIARTATRRALASAPDPDVRARLTCALTRLALVETSARDGAATVAPRPTGRAR